MTTDEYSDPEIEALEALLAQKRAVGPLRRAAADAKAAYAENPGDDELKAAHRAAAAALQDARAEIRSSDVIVAPGTPGSLTVSPATITTGAGKG